MTVIINGTTGITNVNGSAAAPAETGTDTDTGIVYGTNTVTIATNGTAGLIQNASQNVGIGATPSAWTTNFGIRALQVGTRSAIVGSDSNTNLSFNNYYDGTDVRYQANTEASYYLLNGVRHTWYSAPTGTAGNVVTFTQVLSVEKDTSLALQGATTKSGTGITFPATQSASSDANTLDDYEEGTWTPSCAVSITYNANSYVKIGNTVYLNVFINVGANSSSAGMLIVGLPYVLAAGANASVACFNATGTPLVAYMDSNGIYIRDYSNNTKACSVFSGSFIAFQLQYKV